VLPAWAAIWAMPRPMAPVPTTAMCEKAGFMTMIIALPGRGLSGGESILYSRGVERGVAARPGRGWLPVSPVRKADERTTQ
jgi:hypothetical protein